MRLLCACHPHIHGGDVPADHPHHVRDRSGSQRSNARSWFSGKGDVFLEAPVRHHRALLDHSLGGEIRVPLLLQAAPTRSTRSDALVETLDTIHYPHLP